MPDLSLEVLSGQLLVCGFEGTELPDDLAADLANGLRGGVILFKRNLTTPDRVHELCGSIARSAPADLPPFIAIDQEGGRVARLGPPVTKLPPMRVLGEIGDPELVRRAGAVLGAELAALGFNVDFAPVLDVDSNPHNPIIGDRAFGSHPDDVARLGSAFAEGLQSAGVMACGKHFPGHGDTSKDSHIELPVVSHDKQRLDSVELPPFRTASLRKIASLMTAHVVYSGLDPGVPATLSFKIATSLLRNEIGFGGVLFSDDLEMRAVLDHYSIEQIAVGAIRAGCDALLVCKEPELQRRAHAALVAKASSDPDFRSRCQQAFTRSIQARRRFPPRPALALEGLFGRAEAEGVIQEIAERQPA
jgi:beta-N-acetylhexosaminidase